MPRSKLRFRKAGSDFGGNTAKLRLFARLRYQHRGAARLNDGAHEHAVDALDQFRVDWHRFGFLFNRHCFSGEDGLVHEEVVAFQHKAVRRYDAACGELYEIAVNEFSGGDFLRRSVAQRDGFHLNASAEPGNRVACAVLLQKAEHSAAQYDCKDDQRVQPVARRRGDCGCNDHNQDDRAFELAEEQERGSNVLLRFECIFPARFEAGFRFRGSQPGLRRAKTLKRLGGRHIPIWNSILLLHGSPFRFPFGFSIRQPGLRQTSFGVSGFAADFIILLPRRIYHLRRYFSMQRLTAPQGKIKQPAFFDTRTVRNTDVLRFRIDSEARVLTGFPAECLCLPLRKSPHSRRR